MMRDYRPHYHFTPPRNWMNDPNGLVYHDGEYHLFYQHNPYGTAWGHMSWGHAVSKDLLAWEHLPIAIMEEPEAGYTIFSGSAVMRGQRMFAFYSVDYREDGRGLLETIHCAVSDDQGRTFTQSSLNPLIDVDNPKFGDPKVLWDDARSRWVMANICGEGQGHVKFYGSDDLETWTFLSEFHHADTPGTWECPDLFLLPVADLPDVMKWVLKVNYLPKGAKRFTTRFFVGDFDGITFSCDKVVGENLTSGDGAIYAEVSYNDDPDGRRILMGWLREEPLEGRPWTGAQAIPRELYLTDTPNGIELCQFPITVLDDWCSEVTENPCELRAIGNHALMIELRWKAGMDFVATLTTTKGVMRIGIDTAKTELYCEHENKDRVSTQYSAWLPQTTVRIYLDEAIVEVFADHQSTLTTFLPYGAEYDSLQVDESVDVHVWSLVNPA